MLRCGRFFRQSHVFNKMLDEETWVIILLQHFNTVVAHLPAAGRTFADGAEQFLWIQTVGFRIDDCFCNGTDCPGDGNLIGHFGMLSAAGRPHEKN